MSKPHGQIFTDNHTNDNGLRRRRKRTYNLVLLQCLNNFWNIGIVQIFMPQVNNSIVEQNMR